MIKCPVCQAKYPENTLFCEECGSYLPGGDEAETDPLAVGEITWMEKEEFGSTVEVPEEEVVSPVSLKLSILDSGRDMELSLTKEVNIGRLDPASASFPDIDLTSDGGPTKGVSRRHAKITRRGSEVFIEDLGSINGTFLNRKKLTPYFPQALKSGDELRLGKLTLRVSFTK
ncbi:MAG: FHA domain-containing protein [Dehalococcoidia bacterium]